MNKWTTLGIGIFVVAVIAGVFFVLLPPRAQAPTTTDADNAAEKADKIRATAPTPNSTVTSPLTVTGQARGTWYFEASFPYELRTASGTVIAQGPVQAQSDWMTEDFVPFSVSIPFPPQLSGSEGTLILHKDNPSGLPENEDQLIIPVVF